MEKWIIKAGYDLDPILEELGDKVLFATEEEGILEVIVNKDRANYPFIERVEPYHLPKIDWEQDWALHGLGLKEGLLEVPVGDGVIKMRPGPGFGNLSHPTTALMLQMMSPLCKDKVVLDIGTGSGILALAAFALGARSVFALDIDPEAIEHAKENALLNDFNIHFESSKEPFGLTLLNMITSEQKSALQEHEVKEGMILTSGVLEEEKEDYLEFAKGQGWRLQEIFEKEGWLAFCFTASDS